MLTLHHWGALCCTFSLFLVHAVMFSSVLTPLAQAPQRFIIKDAASLFLRGAGNPSHKCPEQHVRPLAFSHAASGKVTEHVRTPEFVSRLCLSCRTKRLFFERRRRHDRESLSMDDSSQRHGSGIKLHRCHQFTLMRSSPFTNDKVNYVPLIKSEQ